MSTRFLSQGAASRAPRPARALCRAAGVLPTAVFAAGLSAAPALPLSAQASSTPPAIEVGLLLRQLDGVKRVLLVGAHPDDEDTSLLAILSRGHGAEAEYVSLTRGEGGQNLLGPELGEGLGIVRTGELLSARSVDGASQSFTRAYDFGYSKTAEETFRHWDRARLLADLVRLIRRMRPQILVSIFSGTPQDGHGQHQAAGLLTLAAWEAAGDRSRFPEQLAEGLLPWTPLKLYRRTYFDPEASTLVLPTGELDPLLGRSYHQLAMESRSHHRSQDFGTAQTPGPHETRLALLASRVPAAPSDPLFAGVDTTFAGALGLAEGPAAATAVSYRRALAAARAALVAEEPGRTLGPLVETRARLERLAADSRDGPVAEELRRRMRLLDRALLAAAGVRVEVRARDDVVVPGQSVVVETRVWNGGGAPVTAGAPDLRAPQGWETNGLGADDPVPPDETGAFGRFFENEEEVIPPGEEAALAPGALALWRFRVSVPERADDSGPYYLDHPRDGAMYRWPPPPSLHGLPFQPPPVEAGVEVRLAVGDTAVTLRSRSPVRYRGVDKATGEYWRPFQVAPRISVTPAAGTLAWPLHDSLPRELAFRVVSHDPEPVSGTLSLETPSGWTLDPPARGFELGGSGATTTLSFTLEPPTPGREEELRLEPVVTTKRGEHAGVSVSIIDYPHIEPRVHVTSGGVRIVRFPVRVAGRRVGYVMGSGDDGPEAIRQLGLEVESIGRNDWSREALDRFDTIVLGVRAYETRPDLIAANPRLLDWVRSGGTLVVQYNKYEFNDGDYAPYPIEIAPPAPRVADEGAPVVVREPDAPLLTTPNRITAEDFSGWVQERGLYFPTSWDPAYSAPLGMADPSEEERRGSLLVAPVGDGLYVHTSLSFFRQLPAGISGAYRLWANLLSATGEGGRAAGEADGR